MWSVSYSEELRVILSFLVWINGKMELLLIEKGKFIGRGSFGE